MPTINLPVPVKRVEFYRYDDYQGQFGVQVELTTFTLTKETPKGYWIGYFYGSKDRWVSKTSHKRFAYPSKQEALESYKKRKKRQIAILSSRLSKAQEALHVAETWTGEV